jgi:arginyl-tRNA synthetase
MKYAKFLKTNPLALAESLKTVLEELDDQTVDRVINKVEVKAPGFINIYLSNNFYEKVLNQALAGTETFGDNKLVEGEKWAVEHTSPNPNKAMHIGHLRNNLVGMSLSNLLESCGATVTKEAIMNDRGIAIAKLMYGYLYGMLIENSEAAKMAANEGSTQELIHFWTTNNHLWHTPESLQIAADLFTTQCYIKGEELMVNHEAEIRQLVVDWENGDVENRQLWKHVLSYSYQVCTKPWRDSVAPGTRSGTRAIIIKKEKIWLRKDYKRNFPKIRGRCSTYQARKLQYPRHYFAKA